MFKKISILFIGFFLCSPFASALTPPQDTGGQSFLQAVINSDEATEIQKSTIFDASLSFNPYPSRPLTYKWDFGDGNRNEGIEVLHSYKNPGRYVVTLKVSDNKKNEAEARMDVFAYRKLLVLITDQTTAQERIQLIQDFSEKKGVYIKVIDSFGSGTEFISEEVLNKKITKETKNIQKAGQFIIWTKENAGLNALSRYIQSQKNKTAINLSQKTIVVLEESISSNINRIQRQFDIINPKNIIVSKEAAIYPLIESSDEQQFIETLKKGGYEYETVNAKTGKLMPWNFMSYFVNILINNSVPDNIIALLLLLPVIATVVTFMKQIVGSTTFGVYTPCIITLSFLVIGIYAGLLTLAAAIIIGILSKPLFKQVRMLFIPKMAVLITIVSLVLFLILIASVYLGLFDAEFLSIAVFPMLILSTLVEKFISVKTEKGLSAAFFLMLSTIIVSIIAYFLTGGEINIGFAILKFDLIKSIIMSYPELILLLIVINILLGKWTGLRILERIRFREVLRHIEE